MIGLQQVEVSPPGDFTVKPFVSVAPAAASYRAFLSEVDVETTKRPVIVTLGDSITDGFGSATGTNHRWPDLLAERFAAGGPAAPAVVNAGISGNRILGAPSPPFRGDDALARFDRDVLSVPGVTHVIMLEGINDISGGGPSAETLIMGYRQIIMRAHAHGLKVLGATLTPFLGAPHIIDPAYEAVREKLNDWIRHSGAFDGMIDFDAAVRDPKAPNQMRAELQSGDWLHPNDDGYRAMAYAIDLRLFR
jgi:lysophospholipase L1-like esterase